MALDYLPNYPGISIGVALCLVTNICYIDRYPFNQEFLDSLGLELLLTQLYSLLLSIYVGLSDQLQLLNLSLKHLEH